MRLLRAGAVPAALLLAACARTPDQAPFLGGTQTTSLRATATGREYQVSVAVPLGYEDSAESYSVLVGVDANGQFGTLVEMARHLRNGGQIPPLVVVGVGFPVGGYQRISRVRRRLELTPTGTCQRQWDTLGD